MFWEEHFLLAIWLTLFAWLSTWIGSFSILFLKKFNPKFLAAALWFSAWIMLYVSFIEIFPKWIEEISNIFPDKKMANIWWTFMFFLWIWIIGLIDFLLPDKENPHEIKNIKMLENESINKKLLRMWLFSALAITIHNFPEGLATFVATLKEPELWITIAFAIAIHNIPEWIAVSVPIYYATKNKLKASLLWLASWFAEFIGALLWFFILLKIFPDLNFGFIFTFVAWIMVYISLDELLPTAEEYWEHHIAILGLIFWMLFMSLSLLLMM